ncbi:hypothetical protein DOTSEDRAFT_71983 [Dothistroma septosporum NZE10]|uniref:Uncharacterized protein n=1 Tax=Dothistroma septosporum (strain NZE10 / CBS 128990) TaxID=675120 RepID=N1PPH2_DOTSN|nr:hypothetical protein DOTSEDRAFT_71983 [Dothistroma septosporum NZE10]
MVVFGRCLKTEMMCYADPVTHVPSSYSFSLDRIAAVPGRHDLRQQSLTVTDNQWPLLALVNVFYASNILLTVPSKSVPTCTCTRQCNSCATSLPSELLTIQGGLFYVPPADKQRHLLVIHSMLLPTLDYDRGHELVLRIHRTLTCFGGGT